MSEQAADKARVAGRRTSVKITADQVGSRSAAEVPDAPTGRRQQSMIVSIEAVDSRTK